LFGFYALKMFLSISVFFSFSGVVKCAVVRFETMQRTWQPFSSLKIIEMMFRARNAFAYTMCCIMEKYAALRGLVCGCGEPAIGGSLSSRQLQLGGHFECVQKMTTPSLSCRKKTGTKDTRWIWKSL
jgi:hypothetical protein